MRGDILIVDDEAGPRESLRMILKADHDVRTAASATEALEEVDRQPPDLVFLDLRMPDMHGTEVLKAIKTRHPDVEVAIITAYAGLESARLAVRYGAIDYLTKPYSVADVQRIVERALAARRREHDAEVLAAQIAKLTEALSARDGELARAPSGEVATALASLRSLQNTLQEDLDTLREFAQLGEVAAEVTHDINNLLAVILTSAQFLLYQLSSQGPGEPEAVAARLSSIVQAAEDCSVMLQRIKDYTRLAVTHEPTLVDLNELVSAAVSSKRDDVQVRGLDIEFRVYQESLPSILADEVALRSVLINLIDNSIDALGEGGLIEISTRQEESNVILEVRDNGCGMPPEVLAKAKEPFFTRKSGRGTGLGLSIADKIVRRHGGTLNIHSAPGQGTTVIIALPAGTAAVQRPLAAEPEAVKPGTVLLVEDEQAMRNLMVAMLEGEGYRVLSAGSGNGGWTLFEQLRYREGVQDLVVVTDQEMPGLTGRDLASRIKQADPSVPVVIVTGYRLEGSGEEDAVLRKPFDVAEFLGCIRDMLSRSLTAGEG